jgi:hypothetical protein
LELLANRVPPSCMHHVFPQQKLVKKLPTTIFFRNLRTVLLVVTKTLAAYQVGLVDNIDQGNTDGTNRRHTGIENFICGFLTDNGNGYKCVTLSNFIIPETESAGDSTEAIIINTFCEGRALISDWRDKTERMYPNRPNLLLQLPLLTQLNIGKLHRGSIMTDTCHKATKQ